MKLSTALIASFVFSIACAPVRPDQSALPGAQPTAALQEPTGHGSIGPAELARALQSVSAARMLQDVVRLSHPEFNGRQTGTPDDRRTALWVATLFHSLGLHPTGTEVLGPGDEPWAQTRPIPTVQIGEDTQLELTVGAAAIQARVGRDYLPVLDSPSVSLSAPVLFAGYGISDPASGLDEYEGLDVRNRIVLFLRGKPERYPQPVTQADKERVARAKGALAFLTLQGPVLSGYEARRGSSSAPVASYTLSPGDERPLPGCWISTEVGEQLLAIEGRTLREIQERLNGTLRPQSFASNALARLSWDSVRASGTLFNVLGLLTNDSVSAPSATDETLVIGAHRDHFGRQAGLLFAGADDNASGTAVILEVARALASTGIRFKRHILFISFSGEEQNLLGSRLYVRQPARPLGRTAAMINVDHVGIGNGRLTVGVTGVPKEIAVAAGNRTDIADKLDVFGFFPGGDHVPFKEADVPTLTVVSGGAHPHFHQASDQADTLQPDILEKAARYVLALAWDLAMRP